MMIIMVSKGKYKRKYNNYNKKKFFYINIHIFNCNIKKKIEAN